VTDIPGTTRDVLREYISLDGLPVHIADTAGIRDSGDRVEAEGVRRARAALAQADMVLLVLDSSDKSEAQAALKKEIPGGIPCIEVHNKADLSGVETGVDEQAMKASLSAKTGQGIPELIQLVKRVAGVEATQDGVFSARTRHLDALRRTREHLATGREQLVTFNAAETLAEELRLAQKALGEITGQYLPDDLLGDIFSRFCIGK
jgi:tRNA modification GTPase